MGRQLLFVLPLSAMATAVTPGTDLAPFAYPGAGFRAALRSSVAGLGYPPLALAGYPTWGMQASTAAYFLGNDTGLNSAKEMAAEARFGLCQTRGQGIGPRFRGPARVRLTGFPFGRR